MLLNGFHWRFIHIFPRLMFWLKRERFRQEEHPFKYQPCNYVSKRQHFALSAITFRIFNLRHFTFETLVINVAQLIKSCFIKTIIIEAIIAKPGTCLNVSVSEFLVLCHSPFMRPFPRWQDIKNSSDQQQLSQTHYLSICFFFPTVSLFWLLFINHQSREKVLSSRQ